MIGTGVELPTDLLQLSLRWVHVLAAVLWVGTTFWLEWAWRDPAGAPLGRRVVELLARTLFWLRWGAAAAWLTGASLLMVLYYSGPYFLRSGVRPELGEWGPVFAGLCLSFLVYDLAFRVAGTRVLPQLVFGVACGAGLIAFGRWLESRGVSNRAVFAHLGGLLGTSMAGNVWMRIGPCWRRALEARRRGERPQLGDLATAASRSRHNAYMAFPLVMLMVGCDQPGLTGSGTDWPWIVGGLLAVGAALCAMVYAALDSLAGVADGPPGPPEA